MKRDDRFGRPFRRHPLAAAALLACIEAASALPQGERVVAGDVGFARPGPASLTIQQRSAKGIVSWGAFSIDRGEWVRIQQPQSSSVLLNRVRGADASRIFGQLTANGQVFLLNPNGVLFGPNAQVDVGGMVASTLGLSDDDFLAGRYRFSGAGGSVANQGRISAAERGTVALLGGSVRNDGTVEARLGTVALAAGSAMTLDLAGDGLSRIVVTRAAIDAQVANGGAIVADGGAVLLKASAVEALAGAAVGSSGVLRARTLVEREGRIVLDAGDRGTTVVTGSVDATAPVAGTRGGEVELLGRNVGVSGPARVDASGAGGGGRVLVGGDLHGSNPDVRNAEATYVGPGATLRADALERGNGGEVIVWGDEATRVHGALTARGGPKGGDGGLVETSGKRLDTSGARVDASAPRGKGGTWLIDPVDLQISEGPVGGSDSVTDSPDFESVFNSDAPSVVTSGDIEAALNTGTSVRVATGANAAIPQPGDVTIAPGTTIDKTAGGDARLTIEALRHITGGGGRITSSSGRLDVDFNARSGGGASGAIALSDFEISTNGGGVRMYGASNPTGGRARGDNLNFYGIGLSEVSIDTVPSGGGAGGNVVLRGQGGSVALGAGQLAGDGVAISGGRSTASGAFAVNAGSGSVTIDGIAGPGAGGAGVRIEGDATTAVLTKSGPITITGVGSTPGAGFGSGGTGVRISLASEGSGDGPRLATTSGNLQVTGTGGAGGVGGAGGDGVVVRLARLESGGGSVTVVGTGGAGGAGQDDFGGAGGNGGLGVLIEDGTIAGTTAALTITGRGGAGGSGGLGGDSAPGGAGGSGGYGADGIYLTGADVSSTLGAVTLTGTGGAGGNGGVGIDGGWGGDGGSGIQMDASSLTTNQGAITLTGLGGAGGFGAAATDGFAGLGGWGGAGVKIIASGVAAASGSLSVSGTGGAGGPSGQGGRGVAVIDDASLSSTGGSVSIVGVGGAGGAGQAITDGSGEPGGSGGGGVYLSGAVVSSGPGPITVAGTGGAGGNGGNGVAGGSGGDGAQGIELDASSLTTNQGAITLVGTAGAAGSGGTASDGSPGFGGWGADGVRINGSKVTTTSGIITMTGTGSVGGADGSGDASASLHGSGVALGHDPNSEGSPEAGEVTTGSGAIRITGFATTAAGGCDCDQAGVLLGAGSKVESTAGGTIDIRGRGVGPATASSRLPGVWLLDARVATSGSGPGAIVISGESTSGGPGLAFDSAATVGASATTGNIVLRAAGRAGVDSLELEGTIQSSGVLNIRPGGVAASGALTASDSTPIGIGQAAPATATGLAVDSTELTALHDGFSAIVFGSDSHTGPISVLGATSRVESLTLQNGGVGSAGISVGAPLSSSGNTIMLSSGGPVSQAAGAPITAASLLLHGTQPQSSFQLTNAGNQVSRLATRFEQVSAASTAPVVNFVNAGALTIGPAAVGGSAPSATGFDSATNQPEAVSAARSTSGGDLQVRTVTGNLRLTQDIATLGSDITLVAAGVLDNAGDAQLAPGGSGRWSVWADTWVGEDRGGLSPSTPNPNIYGCVFGAASCASGAALPVSGHHFFYVQRPTISVAADDKQRTYGAANPPLTLSFSGLLAANGDTLADAFAGQPSTAATASSPVGDYPISASPLTSPVGYQVSFTPGVLTIDPALLTIRADDKTKVYGSAVPALTRTVTGLVLGDTDSVISGGRPSTTATAATGVAEGPVPITLSPASASNYAIALVGGRLTITPAPLTVTADDKTKLAGTRNPALTATFNGFVAGDTPAIAQAAGMQLSTTAQTLSPPGEYPIRVNPFVLSNYTITTVPGTMRVLPPAQLENPTRAMASETSDLYGRNMGLPTMCFAPGVAVVERTALQTDTLSIEWSRVRQKPNLGNCVGIDQTNACSDF